MISVLATNNNDRGDIFTRLVSDIFHSLGYDQLRFNIHQTGREVDVIGTHCTERRMVVAECKAHTDTIGGSELNKFYGVLDAEGRKSDTPVEGYFVSISGFKESGIQQEKDLNNRFSLLGPAEIIFHLIRGHIIVSQSDAIAESSKWLKPGSKAKVAEVQLLAHDSGWYWLVTFFNPGSSVFGYSMVHADGYILERARSSQIASLLEPLAHLVYIGPDTPAPNGKADEARARYLDYVIAEYGSITLEGLPADQEVGSRSLRLENIFVPLHLEKIKQETLDESMTVSESEIVTGEEEFEEFHDIDFEDFETIEDHDSKESPARESVGEVLKTNSRLALLGSPGAGKTTLIKRLAVAYAAPGRRNESTDRLPARDWFPVVIRCRHLGPNVSQPILKGIKGLAERAEMPELGEAFLDCVTRELRDGKVLLLVDGLDEIASPVDRSRFVGQLRTFLGTYPSASMVVTSREYGFRSVAGAVASLCTTYRVAELSNSDVTTITLAWHKEVVGPSATVRADAQELAYSILRTDRVRRLAVNPLLLTTLLLVRRWLGELPRKRSVLYSKAIEVLLMTWNVEGHQPLDPDEAIPQLAFAAFCMMQRNVQSVSVKQLTDYFGEARQQMPELLGYSRLTVSEFVSRVEERSSLLSLSGHILEDGQLRAIYEFKHLTFQEYLAAVAAAEGYYPDRREDEKLVDVLDPYLNKSSWREVIPLAGVLGGRSSGALIDRIINKIGPWRDFDAIHAPMGGRVRAQPLINLLMRCLADEVPLGLDLLERAIATVITQSYEDSVTEVVHSRYGPALYRVARTGYESFDNFALPYGQAIADSLYNTNLDDSGRIANAFEKIPHLITRGDPMERAEGCLLLMHISFLYRSRKSGGSTASLGLSKANVTKLARIKTKVCRLLEDEQDPRVLLAGFWALCWLMDIKKPTSAQTAILLSRLWQIWQSSADRKLQRQCAWAIWKLPILKRDRLPLKGDRSTGQFLIKQFSSDTWRKEDYHRAALTMGYYFHEPWTDEELAARAADSFKHEDVALQRFIKALGGSGADAVRTEDEKSRGGRQIRKAPPASPPGQPA